MLALTNPPLRVCYLIDELATAGTETQLLALLRHLDRSRIQPYLVLLRGDDPVSRALEPVDIPVLRLGVGALSSPRAVRKAAAFARFLRRERIDVVQTYFPDSSYFGIPIAWLAGVRHRLRTRNNVGHWLNRTHRFLGRLLNAFTTGTIANCRAARAALLAAERPKPASVVVLENGVDLDRFLAVPPLRSRRASDPVHIGAVANLRAVKGLDVLVEAARRLRDRYPQARFTFVGEGPERGNLERAIRKAEMTDRFSLPGLCQDVPGFLGELDVAVLPSRAEGMPNAVLEYMAAGRPVVATRVGATPELIVDGEHGLLVPPEEPPALARAIDQLLTNPTRAARLSEAARVRVVARHGREAMVRKFEEFYEGLGSPEAGLTRFRRLWQGSPHPSRSKVASSSRPQEQTRCA